MESPYQKTWRLQDVIAAIQVMGSSAWATKRLEEWTESLGVPRSAETWEEVLREHPEFFSVRIAPWISAANLRISQLASKLRDAKDPASRYIKDHLSSRTRELLGNYHDSSVPSDELNTTLTKELNALTRREFHVEEPFKQRPLPPEVVELVEQLPPADARRIRNRWVLEAEYPKEIVREDFEPRAALIWRSSYDKNYHADQWKELTSEEVEKLPFAERDRLSRRPLSAEQIHALVSTALEMHTHMLAQQQALREFRAELRVNRDQAREERAQQVQEFHALRDQMRAEREEERAAQQARRWWIPLVVAIVSFVGVVVGTILAAFLKLRWHQT
jgi:hypothetical protein